MDHFDWLSGSQPKALWFVIDHTLEVPMIVSIEKKKRKEKDKRKSVWTLTEN